MIDTAAATAPPETKPTPAVIETAPEPKPEPKKALIPPVNPYMAYNVVCSNYPMKCRNEEILEARWGKDPRTGEPAIVNECPSCGYLFIQSKVHAQGECISASTPTKKLAEVFQKRA
jgi:ssDNA-binding Zn-finger/Zn-ribbon topoisomerase 1